MSADDYAFGHSQAPWRRMAGVFLLGGASMGWAVLLARRNRLLLGSGRPGVSILKVELLTPSRGPARWRVQFADGKHAEYYNTAHQRALLAERIAADPSGYTPAMATAMQMLGIIAPGRRHPSDLTLTAAAVVGSYWTCSGWLSAMLGLGEVGVHADLADESAVRVEVAG